MCSESVLEDIQLETALRCITQHPGLVLSAFKSGAYVWLANVSRPKPNRDIDKLDPKKGEIVSIFVPHWSQIRSIWYTLDLKTYNSLIHRPAEIKYFSYCLFFTVTCVALPTGSFLGLSMGFWETSEFLFLRVLTRQ